MDQTNKSNNRLSEVNYIVRCVKSKIRAKRHAATECVIISHPAQREKRVRKSFFCEVVQCCRDIELSEGTDDY